MKSNLIERLRRDWFIILIIFLLGVCFMLVAGQRATQLVSAWRLQADMRSNLDPNSRFRLGPPAANFEPLKPEILTPPIWNDTYLTPMPEDEDEAVETAVTLVVFDPSSTPSVTPSTSPTPSPTPSPTIEPNVTSTDPPPPTPTKTKKPKDPKPPPPPPVTSTIDPALAEISPPPAAIDVGAPDGVVANLASGNYVVIDMTQGGTLPPITVEGPSETNYDLVYYEWPAGAGIMLDDVVLGISQLVAGNPYYEVFNWGDNIPDTNTNVDTDDLPPPPPACTGDPECDNREIDASVLYPNPPPSPVPPPDTGILIDVDNAPSNPPPGDYDYVVIISPSTGGDATQVDAIEQVDEPPPP